MFTKEESAPLVVVIGATGAQGGSVIRHLGKSMKPYRVRGVTRDPTKPNAAALVEQGVEMVKANIQNVTEIEAAFAGADYAFGVTNFWESMNAEVEMKEGRVLIDTAKSQKLKLFLWSGLESAAKLSHGKLNVAHFDSKAEITEYAISQNIPLCIVQPGFYLSNLLAGGLSPQKQDDGSYLISIPINPNTVVPGVDASTDYGAYVVEGLESPLFGPGTEVLAAPAYYSFNEIAETFSKVSGKTVKVAQVPAETFIKHAAHGGEELVAMLTFFQDYGYYGGKDLGQSQKDLPGTTTTLEQFLKANVNKVFK